MFEDVEDDFELTCTSKGNGKRKRNNNTEFYEGEVSHEKDLPKDYDKQAVLYNKKGDKEDRVINAQAYLSPYAKNLVSGLQDNNRTSISLAMFEIVSATIDGFSTVIDSRYETILRIKEFINNANMSDPNLDLSLPDVVIYDGGKKKKHVKFLVLSSSKTVVNTYAEAFKMSYSDVYEMLIYMYFGNKESKLKHEIKRSLDCKDLSKLFLDKIDKIIDEQTELSSQDSIEIAVLKTWTKGVKESRMKKETADGTGYRIIIEKIKGKEGSGHGKGTRGKSPFRHKAGRRAKEREIS